MHSATDRSATPLLTRTKGLRVVCMRGQADLRMLVERHVVPGSTRRLLLADGSQSLGRSIPFPTEAQRVRLTEVVRCSRRIVAGAMAFQVGVIFASSPLSPLHPTLTHPPRRTQADNAVTHTSRLLLAPLLLQLGGEQKLLTRCHHEAVGPPLKSFLFDYDQASPRISIWPPRSMSRRRAEISPFAHVWWMPVHRPSTAHSGLATLLTCATRSPSCAAPTAGCRCTTASPFLDRART